VLWVGVKPWEKIVTLQKQVDDCLVRVGFDREKKFHPHLTLSRLKFPNKFEQEIEPMEFLVERVELIESTLTPQGPVYEVLKSLNKKI